MRYLTRAISTGFIATCLSLAAPAAPALVLTAGDGGFFSGWSFSSEGQGPGPFSASLSRVDEGSNSALRAALSTAFTLPNKTTVWGMARYGGFAFSPATGALETVSMDVDVKRIVSNGAGQAIKILAVQAGRIFLGPAVAISGIAPAYVGRSLSVAAADFVDGPFGSTGTHLDLSPTGAAIQFGFAVGNTNAGPRTHHYDNWALRLAVTDRVPEPLSVALLGLGLLVLPGITRARARRR